MSHIDLDYEALVGVIDNLRLALERVEQERDAYKTFVLHAQYFSQCKSTRQLAGEALTSGNDIQNKTGKS